MTSSGTLSASGLAAAIVLLAAAIVLLAVAGCDEPSASRAARAAPTASASDSDALSDHVGTRVQIAGRWATVWASSELASDHGLYAAARAFDGDPATAWVEGVDGVGARGNGASEGETLVVEFEDPVEVEGVGFMLGYTKSPRLFARNAAPTVVGVTLDGGETALLDVSYVQDIVFEGERFGGTDRGPDRRVDGCYHSNASTNVEARRVVVFKRPRTVRRLAVEIAEARPGTHYTDTALSEVVPIVVGGTPAFVPNVVAVLRSLRAPGGIDKHLSPGADVRDLRAAYLSPGLDPVFRSRAVSSTILVEGQDGYEAVAWARVPSEDRVDGESPEDQFVRYARPYLIGSLATIIGPPGKEQIVGARSFHQGDCEWVESYPLIQLQETRVSQLTEWVTGDGCPGCTWRIPAPEDR